MKKAKRILLVVVLLGCAVLTACTESCTETNAGYFYIRPYYGQYVVALDTDGTTDTEIVSRPMSLPEATYLANKLNQDMNGNWWR